MNQEQLDNYSESYSASTSSRLLLWMFPETIVYDVDISSHVLHLVVVS